jgi:hypothetical protein
MSFKNIFTEIEKVDPEVYQRLDTRRSAMKEFTGIAGKLTLAALPIALAGMFKKAYGQTTIGIYGILNYALRLEMLEDAFYKTAITASNGGTLNIPTPAAKMAIQTIGAHETAHVNLLKGAITAGGAMLQPVENYDFTGSKNNTRAALFPGVFTNYAMFLAVAQALEDTGVRAYKGQAADPALMANNDVLTIALQIHSVEARHASHIRQMRKANGGLVPAGVKVKPWITLNQSGIDSPNAQGPYNGEELTRQATIDMININGKAISANAASEAFDEPLTKEETLAIAGNFIY